jgi:hypothetical protein
MAINMKPLGDRVLVQGAPVVLGPGVIPAGIGARPPSGQLLGSWVTMPGEVATAPWTLSDDLRF